MKRLRILHLITGLSVGGAEMVLYRLVSGMDRARFENGVVTLWGGGSLTEGIAAQGIPVRALPMRRGAAGPGGLVALVRLLRAERPDVLQTWMYHADLIGTVGARLAGVRRLAWNVRASNFVRIGGSRQMKVVGAACAALTRTRLGPDVVVVNSQAGRAAHAGQGYRPRRWEVIPNGFDLDRYRPDAEARYQVRMEMGIGEDPVVGHVGRFDPMKDHQTFLRAAAAVRAEFPQARFVMVGSGVDAENRMLRELSAALGLEGRVHFLGERSDLPQLMAAMDVLVSSSAYAEGFPNVVGEAMACGVPCVVTDVGDSASIVEETGIAVPPRSAERLAEAIGSLLALPAAERAALGTAARERVRERFSLSAVVRRYEALYEGLVAG